MFDHPHLTLPKVVTAVAVAAVLLTSMSITGSWSSAQQVLNGPIGVYWLLGSIPAAVFVMLEVPAHWARSVDATVAVVFPAAVLTSLVLWTSLEPKSAEKGLACTDHLPPSSRP